MDCLPLGLLNRAWFDRVFVRSETQDQSKETKSNVGHSRQIRLPERSADCGSHQVDDASETSNGRFSQFACIDQWQILSTDPFILRWWHFFSLLADNTMIGIVYGWAWYAAGASWRIVPPILYVLSGTVIMTDVLVHGPSSKASRLGPLLGATQLFFSTLPLFQPRSKVR